MMRFTLQKVVEKNPVLPKCAPSDLQEVNFISVKSCIKFTVSSIY